PTPLAAALFVALGFLCVSACASASVLVVGDCGDGAAGNTLRNLIAAASTADAIDASACVNSTITLGGSEIAITQPTLTIYGPPDDSLTIDAANASRVFNHSGTGGSLTLQHLKLVHGLANSSGDVHGGCLISQGDAALTHVSVSSCTVSSNGQFAS